MSDPRGYGELGPEQAGELAAPFLDGPCHSAEEIGDGNLNLVFRVQGTGSSLIVKQALPYLRIVGEGWPLTLDRARIEAEALELHARLAPGRVPALLHYEPTLAALVLEDLHDHEVWRGALVAGRWIDGIPEQLGDFCARTLLGSSDLLMPAAERKTLVARLQNPDLCAITEDLVFTSPFTDSPSNQYDDAVADVAESLRRDRALRSAAAMLRFRFRTRAESLLHGDLHTGSVLAAPNDARAFDPEFAFPGPMGFDIGNVVANLALARVAHAAAGDDPFALRLDSAAHAFWDSFTETVGQLWPPGEPWRERFLATLLGDATGYAGAEMVRRIVGLAHVADVDSLGDAARERAQRAAVAGGRALIVGGPAPSLTELWARATTEEEYT